MALRSLPTSPPVSSRSLIRKGSDLPNSCLNPVSGELQTDTKKELQNKEVQNGAINFESRLAEVEEKMAAALRSVIFDVASLQTDVTALKNTSVRYIDGEQKAGTALERVAGVEVLQRALTADHLEQKKRIDDLWAHRQWFQGEEATEPSVRGERQVDGDETALQRVAALEVRLKASESEYLELKSQFQETENIFQSTKNLLENYTILEEADKVESSPESAAATEEIFKDEEEADMQPTLPHHTTLQEVIKEDGQEHASYTFSESVWDAFMLQWFSEILSDKLLMVLIYFLNLLLQGTLVYLIYENMGKAEWVSEDDLVQLLQWRIGVSHQAEFYDSKSNTSLAGRVCSNDGANIMSGSQAQLFSEVDEYKTVNAPFNGPMLCVLSICIWLMVMLQELMNTTNAVFAILSVTASSSGTSGEWQGSGGEISFSIRHATCSWRCCMLIFLALPRFVFAIVLGWSGVIYLANSSSLGDLILNAMALGFVLDMDELIFMLVPDRTAWFLSITQPVVFKQAGAFWTKCRSPLMLFLIGPLMVVTEFIELQPLYDRLNKVQAILCGGTTDVLLVTDPSTGIMTYAGASGTAWESLQLKDMTQACEYKICSVLQASGLPDLPELQDMFATFPRPSSKLAKQVSLAEAQQLLLMTSLEGMEVQPCVDVDYDEPARAALQDALGVSSCRMIDARDHSGRCNEKEVRRLCPLTCSCHEVTWWYDRSYCPTSCTKLYAKNLNTYLMGILVNKGVCSDSEAHEDISFDGGNISFFAHFVQQEITQSGVLEADGTPSRTFAGRLGYLTKEYCSFTGVPLNFQDIVVKDPYSGCQVMDFIIRVFEVPLCDYGKRFETGFGNIAAFCPNVCKVCPLVPPSPTMEITDIVMSSDSIFPSFASEVRCGYEWIFCGESLNGTTKGVDVSHYSGPASEKIYTFWADPGPYYTFRVSSTQSSFTVVIYNSQMNVEHQVFADIWASCDEGCTQEFSNIYFEYPGQNYILVEANGAIEKGDFTIEMSSDNCHSGRGEITCNDVVDVSTWDRTNALGSYSPEAIFRFQAEAGVEYTFTSCSSVMDTIMKLYDDKLRIDPLVNFPDSTTECGGKKHETITKKFDEPGTYHILVEGYDPETSFSFEPVAGELQLTMHCAS